MPGVLRRDAGDLRLRRCNRDDLWFGLAAIGLCQGVFALFTMYLPPLFPTLLRTTGAGFCYNIGRIAAGLGTVFFGLFSQVGDYRLALLYAGFLFLPAAASPGCCRMLPEERGRDERKYVIRLQPASKSSILNRDCRDFGYEADRPLGETAGRLDVDGSRRPWPPTARIAFMFSTAANIR